jgi:hypothetical protein
MRFRKKKDQWPTTELDRADRIRWEHLPGPKKKRGSVKPFAWYEALHEA